MNEVEWLTSNDDEGMLNFLAGRASERKRRLFAAACCRAVWPLLGDERSRKAVEEAERFADGEGWAHDLVDADYRALAVFREAEVALYEAMREYRAESGLSNCLCCELTPEAMLELNPSNDGDRGYQLMEAVVKAESALAGARAAHACAMNFGAAPALAEAAARQAVPPLPLARATLLRDVLGNPFRLSKMDAAWRAWEGGTVLGLAEAVYEESAFERLPILADALEDAGCADERLLRHLREPGGHVRGCWGLDAILGRE